ncbi:MAG: ssbA 2 [Clostridiaceae bacterium]|jgi:primosomal replication protein N|nr:ssbA 2 [Clostridiaceae bacterium]
MNKVILEGMTSGIIRENHRFVGKDNKERIVYESELLYKSVQGINNEVKVLLWGDSKFIELFSKSTCVNIEGTFCSFNKYSNEYKKRICELYVLPKVVKEKNECDYTNKYNAVGVICQSPIMKKTSNGRSVVELKLKVQRDNQPERFDYIPLVAYDKKAENFVRLLEGSKISIRGRIHSKGYIDLCNNLRKSYEVGVHELTCVND